MLFPLDLRRVDCVVAERVEERAQPDSDLEAGEGRPEAVMGAVSERNRPRIVPIDPKNVGVIPTVGVAVRCTDHHGDVLSRLDALIADLEIGDGAVIGAQSGVSKNVPPGFMVTGYPAMPFKKVAENQHNLMRIGGWEERVKQLEARLAEIESSLPNGNHSGAEGKSCDS